MDSRIAGALYGMALGDALGAETEFLNIDGIRRRFPPNGPLEPPGNPSLVTDDTQMALAVADALVAAPRPYAAETLADTLKDTFIAWYNDPDNNRAPGNTCLTGCENLIERKPWRDAGDISSKGCGANMRVMPVGLLNLDAPTRAAIAQLQSVLTHAHPTGLAAADLTAWVVADLKNGGVVDTLPRRVRAYAESQQHVYHESWLGELWQRAYMMRSAEEYMAYGWSECIRVLDNLDHALVLGDYDSDPCEYTGSGWIAEEAFGTALLCFLQYAHDPVAVIRRAAFTKGDSDSIAAIAGAFAGAYHGLAAWPREWVDRIEYRERIADLSRALGEISA